MKQLKVKYIRDVMKLEQFDMGDWIDLRCAEDLYLQKGKVYAIPLGVAMELPEGYEAIMAPRSSTFKHWGLLAANSIGVIDEAYKGDGDEWHFLALPTRDTHVLKNERICQFRIIEHQPTLQLVEVESLDNEDRGGIGSTGRM